MFGSDDVLGRTLTVVLTSDNNIDLSRASLRFVLLCKNVVVVRPVSL